MMEKRYENACFDLQVCVQTNRELRSALLPQGGFNDGKTV
nr:MAG TPA: hypothetical protein [Bacteriophage sp.]